MLSPFLFVRVHSLVLVQILRISLLWDFIRVHLRLLRAFNIPILCIFILIWRRVFIDVTVIQLRLLRVLGFAIRIWVILVIRIRLISDVLPRSNKAIALIFNFKHVKSFSWNHLDESWICLLGKRHYSVKYLLSY